MDWDNEKNLKSIKISMKFEFNDLIIDNQDLLKWKPTLKEFSQYSMAPWAKNSEIIFQPQFIKGSVRRIELQQHMWFRAMFPFRLWKEFQILFSRLVSLRA